MNSKHKFFAFSIVYLWTVMVSAYTCDFLDLNCQQLGNILITPKGLEKLLQEQLDVSLINSEAHVQIKSKLRSQKGIVVYQTKPECPKEVSPAEYAEIWSKLKPAAVDGCIHYPIFEQSGNELKPVKFVAFQVRLDNFDAKKSKFDVKDIECPTAQMCRAKVSAKEISAVGQLIIETADGEKLETPHLLLTNKPGQRPASAEFNLQLNPSGEIVSAIGSFDKLNLNLEKMDLRPAIVDKSGKVLNANETKIAQIQEARIQREQAFRDRLSEGESAFMSNLEKEVKTFNDQQELSGLPQVSLKTFKDALLKWKSNPKAYPDVFNQLPSFRSTSENAASRVKGFTTPMTEGLFNSYVDIINKQFAGDPRIRDMVKAELNKGLKEAETAINERLNQVSGELGQTFIQTQDLTVADIDSIIRVETIGKWIGYIDKALESEMTPGQKKELLADKAKLEQERTKLNEKIGNSRSMVIMTQPFFDRVKDMNRVGLFAAGKACPPPSKIQKQGIHDKSQLGGAEFGFELTMESLQSYIDQLHKSSPTVCVGSPDPSCRGGTVIKLTEKPKLVLTKEGGYRLQMYGASLENKIFKPTLGISVGVNITECKDKDAAKQICMSFDKPTVDQKSKAVKFNDSLPLFFKSSDQEVKEGFKEVTEINLSQRLPASISSSFEIKKPTIVGSQGLLVFPINLMPIEQRLILGKSPPVLGKLN